MFITYFYYFIIYAFLGYLCEVVYVSIHNKKLTNRGYLYGPICPIYGYGAILILLSLTKIHDMGMWYLVFILGILLTTALEYITSYVMELIFHMRWWDYSDKKFNIHGRVCLKNSLLFGVLVMVVFYVIQPGVDYVLSQISSGVIWYALFWTILIVYIVDTVASTVKNINITKVFAKLESYANEFGAKISETSAQFKEYILNTKLMKKLQRLDHHYPSLKVKRRDKKERLSLKEIIERIKNDKE